MSPTQFHQRESTANNNNGLCPPPLKINKDSHFIKKSSPSSSSSSSAASSLGVAGPSKQPHRHPVIIYTHSPKVIHTHPKDFMALVQKLTGLSRGDEDQPPERKSENGGVSAPEEESKCVKIGGNNDDNESSSVITSEENCDGHQVNSCLLTPIFDPSPPPFLSNMPVFTPNSAEFYCGNRPFYNYHDSLFYSQNMRSSLSSSSSGFDGINEFRDY